MLGVKRQTAVLAMAALLSSGVAVAAAPAASAAACVGSAAVTNVEFHITGSGVNKTVTDLKGNVDWGNEIHVTFTVVPGCAPVQLTLASYVSDQPWPNLKAQTLYKAHSHEFTGAGTLNVHIHNQPHPGGPVFFQVDFATGPVRGPGLPDSLPYGANLISAGTG